MRVRGRTFSLQHNLYHVLCECRETVKGGLVPPEVLPTEGGGPWPIIRADQNTADLRPLFPTEEAAAKSTEAILRAVSDLLDQRHPSHQVKKEAIAVYEFSLGYLPRRLEKNSLSISWVKHGSWWKSATARQERKSGD